MSKLVMCPDFAGLAELADEKQEALVSAITPTRAHIETAGVAMQYKASRLYRVKAVAESLDVSVATIYRAVESGALRAVRLGTGKGAIRIPAQAVDEYISACERAAATQAVTSAEHSEAAGGVA